MAGTATYYKSNKLAKTLTVVQQQEQAGLEGCCCRCSKATASNSNKWLNKTATTTNKSRSSTAAAATILLLNNYNNKYSSRRPLITLQQFVIMCLIATSIIVPKNMMVAEAASLREDASLSLSSLLSSSSADTEEYGSNDIVANERLMADNDEDESLDSIDVLQHHIMKMQHHLEHDIEQAKVLQMRRRSSHRLHKRHSNKHFYETESNFGWHNPCGGVFQPSENTEGYRPPPMDYFLEQINLAAVTDFWTLNATVKDIRTSDMAIWSGYREQYKFLPKVKANSNIALKRWYRNIQIYVAAFGYLGRTQYNWETAKQISNQGVSNDLMDLINSARHILCEIESAINGSFPNKNQEKLYSYSIAEMSKRLNFTTRRKEQEQLGEKVQPDDLDLKFATASYYKYLSNIMEILENRIEKKHKKHNRVEVNMADYSDQSSSASSSWNSLQEDDKFKSQMRSSGKNDEQQKSSSSQSSRNHLKKRRRTKKIQKSAELPAAAA